MKTVLVLLPKTGILTTPGRQLSASVFGPWSDACRGDPVELSELLSGLDGILVPT